MTRKRVVLEGETVSSRGGGFVLVTDDMGTCNYFVDPSAAHVVSVEDIEPVRPTFQPGDVVAIHGYTYLRRTDGWWISPRGVSVNDDYINSWKPEDIILLVHNGQSAAS